MIILSTFNVSKYKYYLHSQNRNNRLHEKQRLFACRDLHCNSRILSRIITCEMWGFRDSEDSSLGLLGRDAK
jgi:hypothetical protein